MQLFSVQLFGKDNRLMPDAILDLSDPRATVIFPWGAPVTGISISGSVLSASAPVAGVVTLGLAAQAAGTILAGPLSGAPAVPTFKTIASLGLGGSYSLPANLAAIAALPNAIGWLHNNGGGGFAWLSASAILDSIGSVRGSLLYRGAAAWSILTPGTAGYALLSGGAGADPSYALPTLLGTVTTGTWHATQIGEVYGGTNQTTYALGDTLYASASNTLQKLAGNITTTKKFLRQTGTGAVSAAPAWDTIAVADIPLTSAHILVGNVSNLAADVAMTGDISIDNTGLTAIGANRVTLAMMATIANNTVLGNISGGAAVPSAISLFNRDLTVDTSGNSGTWQTGTFVLTNGGTSTSEGIGFGVNVAGGYSWIEAAKPGIGIRDLAIFPNSGGNLVSTRVAIGTTTFTGATGGPQISSPYDVFIIGVNVSEFTRMKLAGGSAGGTAILFTDYGTNAANAFLSCDYRVGGKNLVLSNSQTGPLYLYNKGTPIYFYVSDALGATLVTAGLTVVGSLTTGAPSGAAGALKAGKVTAGAVVLDAANYWEVSIDGVVKKVLLAA